MEFHPFTEVALLDAATLRELLAYDPETGVFTWRVRASNMPKGSVAGGLNGHGYILIWVRGRKYGAHRLGWLYTFGEWPPHEIDHINGARDDNRLANLRLATRAQNEANTRRSSRNTSGVKGVSWHKRTSTWRAHIVVNGKQKHLGHFTSINAAAAAYQTAAATHFGEFANPGNTG